MNVLFWQIITAIFLSNTAYGVVAPTIPLVFEQKQIPRSVVGVIFSIYSVSLILVSPMVPALIKRFSTH
jgi:predicted MFS family arabinose efflux permease